MILETLCEKPMHDGNFAAENNGQISILSMQCGVRGDSHD